MAGWTFLTNHARAMLVIAERPDARLRDVAELLGVTERTAFAIVDDLTEAGYVVKERDGRRNRYHIQVDAPLTDAGATERTVGDLLDLLADASSRRGQTAGTNRRRRSTDHDREAASQ